MGKPAYKSLAEVRHEFTLKSGFAVCKTCDDILSAVDHAMRNHLKSSTRHATALRLAAERKAIA